MVYLRLSSSNFTWFILEYFVPNYLSTVYDRFSQYELMDFFFQGVCIYSTQALSKRSNLIFWVDLGSLVFGSLFSGSNSI